MSAMQHLNVEIKARCGNAAAMRQVLQQHGALFIGTDAQTDTYFKVPQGRLKLRQGNIENALIYYERPNTKAQKASQVHLCPLTAEEGPRMAALLAASLGVLVKVEKRREIYFIDNVKFHLDQVPGLGHFVEIEAIDKDGTLGKARLDEQCTYFMQLLGIAATDLLEASYSDMLLAT